MKLVLGRQPLSSAACRHWGSATVTSPPSGPEGPTIDHYAARARIGTEDSPQTVFSRVRDRLLTYDVFPSAVISYTICPDAPIRTDAIIVQRVHLGPLAFEAAVRVIDVWDRTEANVCEAGFSYVTLQGHPECGVATFRVRLDGDGTITVYIDARSRPGILLTRLGRPFARTFQRLITKSALRRLVES